MATKYLQVNLGRRRVAVDLLMATAARKDVDILLISEPNKAMARQQGWVTDVNEGASLWVRGRGVNVRTQGSGRHYAWAELGNMTVFSCYASPAMEMADFESMLDEMERKIRAGDGRCLVGGDFNAKSSEWGSASTDQRGRVLSEWAARNRLIPLNEGGANTFRRGQSGSVIDVTFASENIASGTEEWYVSEEETLSDHMYIEYRVRDVRAIGGVNLRGNDETRAVGPKYNVKRLNAQKLKETFSAEVRGRDTTAADCTTALERACDESMPRVRPPGRRSAYWWTEEIAQHRKECIAARRALQREFRDMMRRQDLEREYKDKKRTLKRAIKIAKDTCWTSVLEEVDGSLWGEGYKIVTKRLKARQPTPRLPMEELEEVAEALFPEHAPPTFAREAPPNMDDTEKFTEEEIRFAAGKLGNRKAPGPDGIPPEAIKAAVNAEGEYITEVMNSILAKGEYPEEWKVADLLLLRKRAPTENTPPTYRPICLLNAFSKLLEHLLVRRLKHELEERSPLADNQYGFRAGRSTVDAVRRVVELAEEANNGTWRTRKFCMLVTLDVKNAFNNVAWEFLVQELASRGISAGLLGMIRSYLKDRWLVLTDQDGRRTRKKITSGVPQGSVLGPTLWNVFYDGVLRLRLEGVELVAYADDLALVVTAKTCAEIEERANTAIRVITEWLDVRRLQLAAEKTEAVLMIGRRKFDPISIRVGDVTIQPGESVKYLGVRLEKNRSYRRHVEEVAARAERTTGALLRLMPRVGGPRSAKRRVLATVAESVMLYAAPVWEPDMRFAIRRERLLKVQRRAAIGVTMAYRTVATGASLVLAGMVPIHLKARERRERYEGTAEEQLSRAERRDRTLDWWQTEWENDQKGRWTHTLIPDLREWVTRRHGDLTYELTQALTGHGCFGEYLFKYKKRASPECAYCGMEDTPSHTLFACRRWDEVRERCPNQEDLTEERMVGAMVRCSQSWGHISRTICEILRGKKEDDMQRREQEEAD